METEEQTFTRQGITYVVRNPVVEFIETDSRTKKNPDGRSILVRKDRIDSVSGYADGTSTISVNGAFFHVEMGQEDIVRLMAADPVSL